MSFSPANIAITRYMTINIFLQVKAVFVYYQIHIKPQMSKSSRTTHLQSEGKHISFNEHSYADDYLVDRSSTHPEQINNELPPLFASSEPLPCASPLPFSFDAPHAFLGFLELFFHRTFLILSFLLDSIGFLFSLDPSFFSSLTRATCSSICQLLLKF